MHTGPASRPIISCFPARLVPGLAKQDRNRARTAGIAPASCTAHEKMLVPRDIYGSHGLEDTHDDTDN